MTAIYNLDLQNKTLEYYPGKHMQIEFWMGSKKPRLVDLPEEETDAMSKQEFEAYKQAEERFNSTYWPDSTHIVRVQKTPEDRQKQRQREEDQWNRFCQRQTEIQSSWKPFH